MTDLDAHAVLWLHEHLSEGGWLALMCVLTVIGSGWGALTVIPLFASPRTRRFGASLAGVITVTALVVFVLKSVIQRQRPYLVVPGVHPLVFEAPTDFSFPSGHAAGAFAFATFVAVVLVRRDATVSRAGSRLGRFGLALALVAAAFGIALSRCALGVHFPGDIAAGALLGATIGTAGARLCLRFGADKIQTTRR